MIVLLLLLLLPVASLVILSRIFRDSNRAGVIVLGDVGRSPRMRHHCLSLAREGFSVRFVAERGSTIHPDLLKNSAISIYLVEPWSLAGIPLQMLVKPLYQFVVLTLVCLREFWGCGAVVMQNPPCIPVMAVVWLVCRLYGARMIIDWHNYGYTILALKLPPSSITVRIARTFERLFGRMADENFCVTNAMSHDLVRSWGITAYALHDRPSSLTSLSTREKHDLLLRLGAEYPVFRENEETTLLTATNVEGKVVKRKQRSALIVSSTSWTPDEDFSVLLTALRAYDEEWSEEFPDLVCAITGSGPLKTYYEGLIRDSPFTHVRVVTCWLEPEDYPRLLAAADLGVSLHYSSSGLDLPMKVVDMFGAGLPVCARDFACIKELVIHGKNGCVFSDGAQLSRQLRSIFKRFGQPECQHLKILGSGVKHFQSLPWHYHWQHVALPILREGFEFKDYGPEEEPAFPGAEPLNMM